jgi:hypothetical protein
MKIFKISKIVFVLITSIILIHSCTLEEIVPDTITARNIDSKADVTAVIHGAYANLNNPEGFKYNGVFCFLFLAGDDVYATGGTELGKFSLKAFDAGNTAPFWNVFYSVIGNANNLIDILDNKDFGDDFEKRAYGEAYFLRAFSYYYLVRLYGGVPLRTKSVKIDSDFYIKRNTVDEVYKQIFEDFKKASERLPLRNKIVATELGRASKGAAQGLLAQAYLTYANYLDRASKAEASTNYKFAVNYCDSVITSGQYILLNDYGKLWDVTQEATAYEEVMFGIRFTTDPLKVSLGSSGSEFAYRFLGSNSYNVTGNKPLGNGAADIRPQPWFTDIYFSGDYGDGKPFFPGLTYDYRSDRSYFARGSNTGLNTVTGQNFRYIYQYPYMPEKQNNQTGATAATTSIIGKYIDGAGYDSRNHGNDFYIMRYAEIPLIKAEALNELNGPSVEGINLINQLRTRARKGDGIARNYPILIPTNTVFTKQTFRKKILDERGAELFAEGHRWFDLVRMKSHVNESQTMYDYQFGTFLAGISPKTPSYTNTGNLWNNKGGYIPGSADGQRYHTKYKLFPIPTSELIINPNFGDQNPGW